jgi:hypothetical protein
MLNIMQTLFVNGHTGPTEVEDKNVKPQRRKAERRTLEAPK